MPKTSLDTCIVGNCGQMGLGTFEDPGRYTREFSTSGKRLAKLEPL